MKERVRNFYSAANLPYIVPSKTNILSFPIAVNPISFHYVSEMESLILYKYFSQSVSVNVSKIFGEWPKSNREIGHYSSGIKSMSQADLIANFFISACVRQDQWYTQVYKKVWTNVPPLVSNKQPIAHYWQQITREFFGMIMI